MFTLRHLTALTLASLVAFAHPLATPRQEIAGALLGDTVIVVGGFGTDRAALASAEAWRPGDTTWRALPDLPTAVHHPAAAAWGGRLFVFGGYRAAGALEGAVDLVQVYDPTTNAWTLAAPLPRARGGLAAAAIGDLIYVVGGTTDTPAGTQGSAVGDLTAYDPARDAWIPLPPMPTPRDHLTAVAANGRLHVLGGRSGRDFTLDTHEVYDPLTGGWRTAPPLPTGRSGHAAFAADGCIVVLGGEGNGRRRDGLFPHVEAFDVTQARWRRWSDLRTPRHGMFAFPDGPVAWVVGGAVVAGFGAVALSEAFPLRACSAAP